MLLPTLHISPRNKNKIAIQIPAPKSNKTVTIKPTFPSQFHNHFPPNSFFSFFPGYKTQILLTEQGDTQKIIPHLNLQQNLDEKKTDNFTKFSHNKTFSQRNINKILHKNLMSSQILGYSPKPHQYIIYFTTHQLRIARSMIQY